MKENKTHAHNMCVCPNAKTIFVIVESHKLNKS